MDIDKNSITLITPTCGRPQQLSLVVQCINKQTIKPAKWIIIDDGPQPLPDGFFSSCTFPIDYTWHEKQYDKSTTQNTAAALQKVDTEECIIIQDDDYYPPVYIQTIHSLLDGHQNTFLGNLIWRIYRLPSGYYKVRNGNTMKPRVGTSFQWHSAAFIGSGVKEALLQIFKAHMGKNGLPDILAQQIIDRNQYNLILPDLGKASCISLKGYNTGTPGWMQDHRREVAMIRDTDNYDMFKSWLGPDWIRYKKYLGAQRIG